MLDNRRYTAFLALTGAFALVGATAGTTPAFADPGGNGKGNHFGLKIITAAPTVPQNLPDDPYEAAFVVAMNNPDDFGFPAVIDGTVELPAISSAAISLTQDDQHARQTKLVGYSKNRKVKPGVEQPAILDVSKGLGHVKLVASSNKRSVAQLQTLVDQVFDFASDRAFSDARITSSGIGGDGKVILTVHHLTDKLAAALVQRFGTDDIVIEQSDLVLADQSGRNSDVAAFWGGAKVVTPSGGACTSGFVWDLGSNKRGMLTAGHCGPSGGTYKSPGGVVMGTVTSGSSENWSSTDGTQYFTGQTTYRGDLSLITMSTTANGRIYVGEVGATANAAVAEMWSRPPKVGVQYCTGGAYSGELCGWTVTQVGVDIWSTGAASGTPLKKRHVTVGTRTGAGTTFGDSGGPVYTVRASDGRVAAKGIHNSGGKSGSTYTETFTDIYDAFNGLPGVLLTSS